MKKLFVVILGSTLALTALGYSSYMNTNSVEAKESTNRADASTLTDTVISAVSSVVKELKFKDVLDDHWAIKEIYQAVKDGIVNGFEDLSFRPETNVTRAQFIKMTVVATKINQPYTQGKNDAWHTPYVRAAEDAGFLLKNQFTAEQLDEAIPRVEMAEIAIRAINEVYRDPNLNLSDDAVMGAAVNAGIIMGKPGGVLDPEGSTTRAQSVTVISRIQRSLKGEKLEVDPAAVSTAELNLKLTNIFSVMPEFFGGKQVEKWNISNMTIETPDGLYKGVVDKIVAIDFGNPNDPNLNIAGDFNELTWTVGGGKYFKVKDYPDTYGVIVFTRTIYNKDENKYGNGFGGPIVYISGFTGGSSPIEISKTGKLDKRAMLEIPEGSGVMGWIFPKHGLMTGGTLKITASAPAIPPNKDYQQTIVSMASPKSIE